jgi:hypothetical protein
MNNPVFAGRHRNRKTEKKLPKIRSENEKEALLFQRDVQAQW